MLLPDCWEHRSTGGSPCRSPHGGFFSSLLVRPQCLDRDAGHPFRLRTRNEHTRADGELHRPERGAPGDVLERLARSPTLDELGDLEPFVRVERATGDHLGLHSPAGEPEDVPEVNRTNCFNSTQPGQEIGFQIVYATTSSPAPHNAVVNTYASVAVPLMLAAASYLTWI